MDIEQWKAAAKVRIQSGEMTDSEWQSILDGLLYVSESDGLPEFDNAIHRAAGLEEPYADDE